MVETDFLHTHVQVYVLQMYMSLRVGMHFLKLPVVRLEIRHKWNTEHFTCLQSIAFKYL